MKRKVFGPERTRRVLQPALCPNKISVSNLSPTIHILELSIWNLQAGERERESFVKIVLIQEGHNSVTSTFSFGLKTMCMYSKTKPFLFGECKVSITKTRVHEHPKTTIGKQGSYPYKATSNGVLMNQQSYRIFGQSPCLYFLQKADKGIYCPKY